MLHTKRMTKTAKLPTRATDGSAGLDLYADENGRTFFGRAVIRTGISVAIDPGKVGLIWPRSGLAVRDGIDTGAGVIDSDYRGEIKVLLFNHGENPITINRGDRIAQLLIVPVYLESVVEVSELPDSARGANGFGSSGT